MFVNYAHRGASHYYPENTFSGFYAGLQMGANGIETDVRATKDGVLVLFHDDLLEQTTDGSGSVSDYTYRQLLSLNVQNKTYSRRDKIVTLEDFLKYFGFRELYFAFEFKQKNIEEDTIAILNRFDVCEKTTLTSFDFESIKKAKRIDPKYRVGYLIRQEIDKAIKMMRDIGGEELCPSADDIDLASTRRYHDLGFTVRAWGVKTPAIMERVYDCKVDGMTVDFPDLLTELINIKTKRNCKSYSEDYELRRRDKKRCLKHGF